MGLAALWLLACSGGAEDTGARDPGVPVDPLYVPDVADLDLPGIYAEALSLALDVRAGRAWAGHVASLDLAQPGCPDLWAGAPADALDVDEEAGVSWADHCTAGVVDWSGAAWWETAVSVSGDATTEAGEVTDAARTLVADAVVGEAGAARFELDGEAEDALSRTLAPGYDRWTWSSLVTGTVTGDLVLGGTETPGGYRADLYVYAEGEGDGADPGGGTRLEARGNVYLFDDRLAERFDSVALDVVALASGGPSDCTLEPTGWLSVRDTNAYWYDLVFLPSGGEDVDTGLDPACDGCGELYIRGVPSGEVCVDLSAVWDGRLAPPETSEFVWSIHG